MIPEPPIARGGAASAAIEPSPHPPPNPQVGLRDLAVIQGWARYLARGDSWVEEVCTNAGLCHRFDPQNRPDPSNPRAHEALMFEVWKVMDNARRTPVRRRSKTIPPDNPLLDPSRSLRCALSFEAALRFIDSYPNPLIRSLGLKRLLGRRDLITGTERKELSRKREQLRRDIAAAIHLSSCPF